MLPFDCDLPLSFLLVQVNRIPPLGVSRFLQVYAKHPICNKSYYWKGIRGNNKAMGEWRKRARDALSRVRVGKGSQRNSTGTNKLERNIFYLVGEPLGLPKSRKAWYHRICATQIVVHHLLLCAGKSKEGATRKISLTFLNAKIVGWWSSPVAFDTSVR